LYLVPLKLKNVTFDYVILIEYFNIEQKVK